MIDPVQKIKDLADIVDLISEHIPVKRSGASYIALCPFHQDTHPSMHISSTKGIFKCFSCGMGGDVFKFWQEYYKKDFKETLKDLAQKYGVELPESASPDQTQNYNLKIKMHEIAARYYQDQLLAAQDAALARSYLEARQIDTATINQFQLGFSPVDAHNWAKLINLLKSELNCSDEEIVQAGLALKSEKSNKYYDRFRGRLMIPIYDERGRVIGFGARALADENPKYINSPETDIYHKGSNLYGMNWAKEEIRKLDSVILVEGFFDLISLHLAGIKNVVANQGTALTAQQIKLLAKYAQSKKIYLCFDSDKAGRTATDKAAELIMQIMGNHNYQLKVLVIPGNKDADEFVREHGGSANAELLSLIASAPSFIDYQIAQLSSSSSLDDPDYKAKAVSQLAKFLRYVKNRVLFSEYVRQIAFKFKLQEDSLALQLSSEIKGFGEESYQEPKSTSSPIQKRLSPLELAEKELLLIAIQDRSCVDEILSKEIKFSSDVFVEIFDQLVDLHFSDLGPVDSASKFKALMSSSLGNPEAESILVDIGMNLERPIANRDELLSGTILRMQEMQSKEEIARLETQMNQLDSGSEEWLSLYQSKNQIQKKLHEMRKSKILNLG